MSAHSHTSDGLPRASSAMNRESRRPPSLAAVTHLTTAARHFARRTSTGFVPPLHTGGEDNVFAVPTPEEAEAMWEHVLIHYGGVGEVSARHIASVFSSADIPAPSQECTSFLTHEFLSSIGVTAPGDRARVLLAISRMPPPQLQLGGLQVDEHHMRLSTVNSAAASKSYSVDTENVRMFELSSRDRTLTWIDLVGKDASYRDPDYNQSMYARSLAKIQGIFETTPVRIATPPPDRLAAMLSSIPSLTVFSASRVADPPVPTGKMPGAPERSPRAPIADSKKLNASYKHEEDDEYDDGITPISGMSNQLTTSIKLNPMHASETADIWKIMELETPLPHMVYDTNHPGRAAFILRVCTTGANVSDASFGALTNRWVVFADSRKGLVALVHRVDSVALAALRDKDFEVMSDTITFKRVLSSIFVSFLLEFEVALDSSNTLLDDCETKMLDSSKHNDLLEKLFHLQRKASVYERMIDLNQSLIMELGHYFSLTREIAYLEAKWIRLRDKAVALQDRATNLLQLLLALSGHRTNELMSVLTRFSLVFTPMTFVAGVYGMNFENMPELRTENGYFVCMAVLGLMFVVGVLWSNRL